MTAENTNKSKLKTYTSIKKNTFTLVTLQSFSISDVISAEEMKVENWEIYTEVCMTGGIHNTFKPKKVGKFTLSHCKLSSNYNTR